MASQKGDRSRDLGWPARMASTWILKRLRERKVVKGQAYGETLQNSGSWKKRDNVRKPDFTAFIERLVDIDLLSAGCYE